MEDTNKLEEKIEEQKSENEIETGQNLTKCLKERGEYLAGWQRAQADFLNYKKEQNKRVEEILKFVNIDFILKLLPILDNFDLIEKKLPESLRADENIKGILQIKIQVLSFLKTQEIEEIKTIGEKFDPNFHEAIAEEEIKDKESGIIIEEIQKGYIMHGRVIRPAKVKVVK